MDNDEKLTDVASKLLSSSQETIPLDGESLRDSMQPANETVLGLKSGEKVDDFELLTLLGKGAFAQVFLARQVSLERLVALKISSVRGNEPKTLAQLDHPHIVRVFDQRQNREPSVHLLYMEVVPGGTLLEVIERVRRLKPDAPAQARCSQWPCVA